MVQWVRLCASTAGGMGSIPVWGTKTPHATPHGWKEKKDSDPLLVAAVIRKIRFSLFFSESQNFYMGTVPFNVIHLESLICIPIMSHCQHTFTTLIGSLWHMGLNVGECLSWGEPDVWKYPQSHLDLSLENKVKH